MSSVMSLQEENRVLQGELARLEDLLAHSRADRDELAIKYGAISERVRRGAARKRNHPLHTSGSSFLVKSSKTQLLFASVRPF